jgi:hypothetical protein
VTLAGGKAEGGKITIEIDTTSVKTDSDIKAGGAVEAACAHAAATQQ